MPASRVSGHDNRLIEPCTRLARTPEAPRTPPTTPYAPMRPAWYSRCADQVPTRPGSATTRGPHIPRQCPVPRKPSTNMAVRFRPWTVILRNLSSINMRGEMPYAHHLRSSRYIRRARISSIILRNLSVRSHNHHNLNKKRPPRAADGSRERSRTRRNQLINQHFCVFKKAPRR